MCFAPQPHAIFRQQNFKKYSQTVSFFAIFSTSELRKVVRCCRVLYIFTYKCASHHSGVQFFISPLTTCLRSRRFNEPTFRFTRHTNHSKNTAFPDFPNIWRGWIFFLLTFALLHLLSSDLTKCHSVLRTLNYSVLQSTTSYYTILQCTTPYYKVLLHTTHSTSLYSVLDCTPSYYTKLKVLLRATKYSTALQSKTRYHKVL